MRRTLMLMLLFLAGLIPIFTWAQGDEIEGVEIDAQKHLIHYDTATDILRITVRDALEQSIASYDDLWGGLTPPVIVDLLPPPADDADGNPLVGAHSRHTKVELLPFAVPDDTPPEFCLINLYTVPTSPDLEFVLAQEIAQCYMYYNIPVVSALEFEFTPADHGWWGEGASLWMAAQVYDPAAGVDWTKPQAALLEGMEDTLVKNGAGTFWFWGVLADATSKDDVIAILREMPADVNDHVDYLEDKLGPDADTFMHKYVLAIAELGLPLLPLAEDLYTVETLDELPGRVKITSEPMGIGMMRVNVGVFGDNEGFSLELTDLADSGLTVSLNDASPLGEGEVVKFCPTDGKLWLVYSRAAGGMDVDPPAPANLNFDHIDDCDEVPEPGDSGAEGGVVPACVVGSWVVAELPQVPGVPASEMSGVATVRIDRDGNVVTTYTNFSQTMNIEDIGASTLVISGTIRNKIAIDAGGTVVDVGEYTVEGVSARMQVAGMSLDATDLFMTLLEKSFGLPADSVITCVDDNTLYVDITAGSTAARVVYVRG